jgi:hypothetical protein
LVEALQLNGAEVVGLPSPDTPAARMVMDAMPVTGCIFKSPDDVDSMEEERHRKSWVSSPKTWCLTEAAAQRAKAMKWQGIQVVRDKKSLVQAMIADRELTALLDNNH